MVRLPRTRFNNVWLPLAGAILAWAVAQATAQPPDSKESKPKEERLYDDGPLTLADFLGQPPDRGKAIGSPFDAYVSAEIVWSSRFRSQPRGKGFVAQLTDFEAHAILEREKCWHRWKGEPDPRILDHEQGHFDITQCHALRLQQRMRKLISQKKPPIGKGSTMEEAVEDLDRELKAAGMIVKQESNEENMQYDSDTNHGNNADKQQELRRVQLETLRKLQSETTGTNRKSPATK